MNHNRTTILEFLENVGMTNVGVAVVCVLCVVFALPHFLHSRSALAQPANPNMSVADYNRRGNELYNERLFKRAAVEYGHMIEKAPTYAFAYQLRGMAEEQAGDHKLAIRDETEGLKYERDPRLQDDLYFNRGLAYRNLGDCAHAVPDFTQAILLQPDNINAYESRAFCYSNLQEYDRAIADYTVAIAQDPHPGTVFERGQAYLKKNDYLNALADLNRSLQDRPNFAVGYQLRADAYGGLKEYDRAVMDAETALRMENTAAHRGTLGWYQYLAGRLPDSLANSQAALKMDPKLTFARFNIALCYAVQGNAEAAQTAYQDALQFAKAPDIQGAMQDVKDALSKQPNFSTLKQAQILLQNKLPQTSAQAN